MADNKTQIGVRISESLRDQLAVIADENGRSTNQEIAFLIKRHVQEFRKDKPEINLDLLAKKK